MINTILISIVLVMTTIVALIGMVWFIKNVRLHRARKKEDAAGGISLKGEVILRDTQGKENGCAVINDVSISNEHTALSNDELNDEKAATDKYVSEVDGQIPGNADVRDDETNISMESPHTLSAESDEKNENELTPSEDIQGAFTVKKRFDDVYSAMRNTLINIAMEDNTYSKYAEPGTWEPLAAGITSYRKMLECCKNVQDLVSGYEKCKEEELKCRFEEIYYLIEHVMSGGHKIMIIGIDFGTSYSYFAFMYDRSGIRQLGESLVDDYCTGERSDMGREKGIRTCIGKEGEKWYVGAECFSKGKVDVSAMCTDLKTRLRIGQADVDSHIDGKRTANLPRSSSTWYLR